MTFHVICLINVTPGAGLFLNAKGNSHPVSFACVCKAEWCKLLPWISEELLCGI